MSESSLIQRLEDARRACAMRAANLSRWGKHERTIREAKAALSAFPDLYASLSDLVAIKGRKLRDGAYAGYEAERDAAWEAARTALAKATSAQEERTPQEVAD